MKETSVSSEIYSGLIIFAIMGVIVFSFLLGLDGLAAKSLQ